MINYFLPGFVEGMRIYDKIFKLMEEESYLFYNDINIHSIFGNVPNVIWNGGSKFFGNNISINEIDFILKFYSNRGINLQFTMTNPLLEKNDCYDRLGNAILKLISQDYENNCEVLIANSFLLEYVQEKYPNIKIAKSIVGTKEDINFLEVDKYSHIVLPIRYNDDFDKLILIPSEIKEKSEILCNDPCPVDCPRLYTHYNAFANISLYNKDYVEKDYCTNDKANHFLIDSPINYKKIKEKYLPLGFKNFKLSGRGSELQVAIAITPYLVKEKYQLGFLREILHG